MIESLDEFQELIKFRGSIVVYLTRDKNFQQKYREEELIRLISKINKEPRKRIEKEENDRLCHVRF